MTKGELRKLRRQQAAEGYVFERGEDGALEAVLPRTRQDERAHENRMYRWAKQYADRDGAPEGDWDR